jgi:hypothetical protein
VCDIKFQISQSRLVCHIGIQNENTIEFYLFFKLKYSIYFIDRRSVEFKIFRVTQTVWILCFKKCLRIDAGILMVGKW